MQKSLRSKIFGRRISTKPTVGILRMAKLTMDWVWVLPRTELRLWPSSSAWLKSRGLYWLRRTEKYRYKSQRLRRLYWRSPINLLLKPSVLSPNASLWPALKNKLTFWSRIKVTEANCVIWQISTDATFKTLVAVWVQKCLSQSRSLHVKLRPKTPYCCRS
jgi:hypothetical protein